MGGLRKMPFAYAATVAAREAAREREVTGLRKLCAGQQERLIEQQKQINALRRQIARAPRKADSRPSCEAAE
jgi:septal ring factor EnvC (AmiA/AmiB activator)